MGGERILASRAFKAVLGLALGEDEQLESHAETVHNLILDYKLVGLVTGAHQGRQLIRDIEAQAAAQAERHAGRPR